ncbi:MAG: hypothetical protein HY904_10040 [Deltaproteobacteria bacterium]|nr:hypothetical protein [Deltaproteobacteria bacterium]
MSPPNFRESVISQALSDAVNGVPDPALRARIDILVAKTARGLAAARTISFVGYEDRELDEHSLSLWNEVAPVFSAVFRELHALVESLTALFPRAVTTGQDIKKVDLEKDFDLAFDLLEEGEQHPVTGKAVKKKTPEETITDLVHSYAWIIQQAVKEEMKKLREPALMQQQWNLLGELEAFRDRMVGAMHAMVVSVLGVFYEVDVEAVFPQAYEATEMGVAMRRQVADLAAYLEKSLEVIKAGTPKDVLKMVLAQADERTALLLKNPAIGSLRAADRREITMFRRRAAQQRAGDPAGAEVRTFLDGHSKFLASLQSVELRERLQSHDREVAAEAVRSLERALTAGEANSRQAFLYVAHGARRVARLYGVSPELDQAARALRDVTAKGLDFALARPPLEMMIAALKPILA